MANLKAIEVTYDAESFTFRITQKPNKPFRISAGELSALILFLQEPRYSEDKVSLFDNFYVTEDTNSSILERSTAAGNVTLLTLDAVAKAKFVATLPVSFKGALSTYLS